MRKRIFFGILAVALASMLLLSVCVVGLTYGEASRNTWNALQAKTFYISSALKTDGDTYLNTVGNYAGRITLIAPDGTVLFDDKEDPAMMGNHADRPEVAGALKNGTGRAERYSDTMGERTLYYALRLEDGTVLRVAADVDNVWSEALGLVPWLLCVLVVMLVLAALMARWQTKAIVAPINKIDLDHPLAGEAYAELSPLLRRIATQKEELSRQVQALKRIQEEFAVITADMDEGLVVVNKDGVVLSASHSAMRILGAEAQELEGAHILSVNRSLALDKAIKTAVRGKKSEHVLEFGGRHYRVTANPAITEDEVQGAVLLFVDETEKLEAEQVRREFSANVSHELKTPLTSIKGYAEILQNGMVKPQDITDFAGRIYTEADRLVALVEDIIKLSKLDEIKTELECHPVELLSLAKEVTQSLCSAADEKQVAVTVKGEAVTIEGVRSILQEVLYNLVDNAIRYNKEDGRVEVEISKTGEDALLQIKDSGVGIALEQQGRVFERFYQVEKSAAYHGVGTGLGLSIVKHGALFHNGEVSLESIPGQGSVFTLRLPLNLAAAGKG